METPASRLRKGRLTVFKDVQIGDCFEHNGNVYQKKTTRTAAGIWPAVVPDTTYIGQNDRCYVSRTPHA